MSRASDLSELITSCRVRPGKRVDLSRHDPGFSGDPSIPKKRRKKIAESVLGREIAELVEEQEKLYASDTWSLLLILQGLDASGKDSTIKHVMSGINPQGVHVASFKHPAP